MARFCVECRITSLRKRIYPLLLHGPRQPRFITSISRSVFRQNSDTLFRVLAEKSLHTRFLPRFSSIFDPFKLSLQGRHDFFNNSAKHAMLCDSLFLCLCYLVLKRKKKREKSNLSWICCGFIVKNIYLSSNVLGTV